MPEPKTFLSVRNLDLTYGSVAALRNVTLSICRCEVHAVVGEHGAGKSSLAHVLSGFQAPDSGQMLVRGQPFGRLTPETAIRNGIHIVVQHNPLFDDFTVAENILTNGSLGFFTSLTRAAIIRKARQYIDELDLDIDPTATARTLNRSERALVDVIKHLSLNPALLILDETLENLSSRNRQKIVSILNARRQKGMAVLIITHRVDDIYDYADRITILREGKVLVTDHVENVDKMVLIRLAYTRAIDRRAVQADLDFSNILKYNEAILSDLPINLIAVDSEKRVRLLNTCARKLFAITDAHTDAPSLESLVGAENPKCSRILQKAVALKRQTSYYQIPLRLNGRETINTIIVYPIFDGPHLLGNIIIIDDVTQQEKLREQVVLSENLASIGLLAAGVAHEINNPLDIMGGYLENIRFNAGSRGIRDSVRAIEEEVASIAEIVGNLLSFSGKNADSRDEFDIAVLVGDLVKLVSFNAKKNGIRIEYEPPGMPMRIRASKTEIKQVVLNVVKNAFEAMPKGGVLRIHISRAATGNGDRCCIDFDDTGKGIGDAASDMFLPFYSTKKGSRSHAGLGLSIAYGIIKKYSGTISAANRPEGGCRMTIVLPVGREK